MDLQKVETLVDKTCPRTRHKGKHEINSIPGRDDICLAFCTGYDNHLFLAWEKNGEVLLEEIGGADGFQIIIDRNSIKIKEDILEVYCEIMNFIGSSGGVTVRRRLGPIDSADPTPITPPRV